MAEESLLQESIVTSKVIIDTFLLFLAVLPTLVFFLTSNPFKRGFFCDDESIAHPYKESTISDVVLITVGIGLPIVCVIGSEVFWYIYHKNKTTYSGVKNKSSLFKFVKWRVNCLFAEMYINIGMFLFGAAVSQSATDIMKYSIGRLRPHFLDVCQPDWASFNCTDSRGYMRYVEDFTCTGDADLVTEARLSHPSGHASLSSYCMVYLAFYIEKRMRWRGSKLLKRVLQSAVIYMTLYTGLSRISDYKHHWSDVLAGFLLGSAVAVVNALHLSGLFKPPAPCANKEQILLEQMSYGSINSSPQLFSATARSRVKEDEEEGETPAAARPV